MVDCSSGRASQFNMARARDHHPGLSLFQLNNNSDSHGDSSLVNNIGSEQLATPGAIEPQSSLDDPDDSLAEESESVQAPNNEDEEDLLESESLSTAQDTVVASENQVIIIFQSGIIQDVVRFFQKGRLYRSINVISP
jgi:hypothetical protein